MRQAGVIAAAGIVALETMIDRLREDHVLARRLAEAVADMPGLSVNLRTVDTNMVNASIEQTSPSLDEWIGAFKKHGVLVGTHRPDKLRLVTHRHHDADIIDEAIRRIHQAAETIGA
jgi:threonine aldolase